MLYGDGKETRETGEGWPLLTFETEVMGTQRVQMKEVLGYMVRWTRHAGTADFCPALAALVSLIQNIVFPRRTLFHFISPPSPSNLGRQACWVACLRVSGLDIAVQDAQLGQFSTAYTAICG